MSKRLKQGETLLRFILDLHTNKKQVKYILLNSSNIHLDILSEIFYNLLQNQDYMQKHLKNIIKKKKRFLSKFVKLSKNKNKLSQKKLLQRHINTIYSVLSSFKRIIFKYM